MFGDGGKKPKKMVKLPKKKSMRELELSLMASMI